MKIEKEYKFYAGHRNENIDGKCSNLHGHLYKLIVVLEPERTKAGVTMLFSDIDDVVEPLVESFDHGMFINKDDPAIQAISQIKNSSDEMTKMTVMDKETSAENVASLIFHKLKDAGLPLVEIRLKETTSATIVYSLEDYANGE